MMRTLGYVGLIAVATIMVLIWAGGPAAASPAKGYDVTYRADRGHYCVRPLTLSEAERFGIALYRTECRSAAAWAQQGLTVSHG